MSNLHKEWRRNEGTSVKDFVVEKFSEESGYNLIPYFESVGIYVSDFVKSQIYEANYPVLTPLSRNFVSKEKAQEAVQLLNGTAVDPSELVVNWRFGLVSNEELAEVIDKMKNAEELLNTSYGNQEKFRQEGLLVVNSERAGAVLAQR